MGERAFFSSKGPAVDGRFKPDIAAPGLSVVSSYNSFGFAFDPRINDDVVAGTTFGEKTWYYGSLAGTSMAAPVVAGIVALWLEQGPGLAVEGIKELMSAYSVLDGFTGEAATVDRNKWGYGKIDAYEVIRSLENNQTVLVGIEEEPEDAFFPNPTSGMVNFAEIASDVSWRVFAPDGRLLLQGMNKNGEKAVNLGSLASGIYMLEADFSGKKIRKRIAVKK
ncbi:MAG: S8 family peptidase [Cytophagales bacterium]|nr:S8 family peptidase [Cytophagales bacterium]